MNRMIPMVLIVPLMVTGCARAPSAPAKKADDLGSAEVISTTQVESHPCASGITWRVCSDDNKEESHVLSTIAAALVLIVAAPAVAIVELSTR